MGMPVVVQIVGAPVVCADGVKDTWRDLAAWTAQQLYHSCGASVEVRYFDLFDPDCPSLPPNARLPLVIVNDAVFSQGGKINAPSLRREVEALIAMS